MSLEVVYFPVGDLQANTIIVSDPKTKDAVIFDAGGNIPKILDAVKKADVKVHHVYYTHGHFDHVDLSGVLAKELQCPVTLHPADNDLYRNSPTLMRMLGVKCSFATVPPVDVHHEGDKIRVGDVEGVILHTPGHSPGSCSFSFPNLLISGDTLFQGNYGRTDLPGGSMEQLRKSIKETLFSLPDSTRIICGHGEETTIREEKESIFI